MGFENWHSEVTGGTGAAGLETPLWKSLVPTNIKCPCVIIDRSLEVGQAGQGLWAGLRRG